MSDPRLPDLLRKRSERGEPRGADQVWADAAEPAYVAPLPPPRLRARALAIGAAAATLALVIGLVALIGRADDPNVALHGAGDPDAPATCVLEPAATSQRPLDEWAEELLSIPGVTSATPHQVPEGGVGVIFTHGFEPIEISQGARVVSFEVRPVSAVDHLAEDADVGDLTCHVAPEWAYIPDPLPAGTEVLIVFFDPDGSASVQDAYPQVLALLEREGVHAAETKDRDTAWEEFQQLFADSPEMIETVDAELMPESVRLLVDSSSVPPLEAELSARPGVYRVVSPESPELDRQ